MNQPEQATCHCIISHPSKAKFLAVKHADGWSPPVALVEGDKSIVSMVKRVTDSVMKNYGLKTVALRLAASSPGYRCIELEMLSQHAREGVQAVWVGKNEYAQFRHSNPDQFDPIANWLDEKERGRIPDLRPSWERDGWFEEARQWIERSLALLQIKQTGHVEQYRAFRTSSSILRVPTAQGMVYFKACFGAPPAEAKFTQALARHWPAFIPEPLCVDEQKNWMLSSDLSNPRQPRTSYRDYPEVARILSGIQVGSLESMSEWQDLECPMLSLQQLSDFADDIDQLSAVLTEGGGEVALSSGELETLARMAGPMQVMLEKLSDYSIPDMLVHPDMWFVNIIRQEGGLSIIDWSGTVIAHPFFSLLKLIRFRALEKDGKLEQRGDPSEDSALIDAILDSYLEAFTQFESRERLLEAISLVRQIEGLWRLYNWQQALTHEENLSVGYQRVARHLQKIARTMIEGFE